MFHSNFVNSFFKKISVQCDKLKFDDTDAVHKRFNVHKLFSRFKNRLKTRVFK